MACAAGCVAVAAAAFRVPPNPLFDVLERLELRLYDARVRAHGGLPFPRERIAVVGIDDESLARMRSNPSRKADARWPLPIEFHTLVAQRLLDWGARAVAFDLPEFAEPSRPLYAAEDSRFA